MEKETLSSYKIKKLEQLHELSKVEFMEPKEQHIILKQNRVSDVQKFRMSRASKDT